jgi:hypothetical protein
LPTAGMRATIGSGTDPPIAGTFFLVVQSGGLDITSAVE